MADRVGIVLLYPNLLGTYGDGGNARVLLQRLRWRGIDAEVVTVDAGDVVPDSGDLYLFGGGEDGPQAEAARALNESRAVHRAVDGGATVFAVCAGLQILGTTFADKAGRPVNGLGLLDCQTVKTEEPRAVGELVVEPGPQWPGLGRLTGFENHGGRTRLGPDAAALGPVTAGVGNGWGTEGVTPADRGAHRGNVLGTYLHGPALARNPQLADLLLSWVLQVDRAELAPLRRERFRAVEAGRLDGVASRTIKDRLLRRN
jgi:lipid II isoglutaminyl synthase (glutamine-hydrolysing)